MFDKIRNIKMFDCFISSSANNWGVGGLEMGQGGQCGLNQLLFQPCSRMSEYTAKGRMLNIPFYRHPCSEDCGANKVP